MLQVAGLGIMRRDRPEGPSATCSRSLKAALLLSAQLAPYNDELVEKKSVVFNMKKEKR